MAWSTPAAYSVGELVTAARLNSDVVANLDFLHDRMHGGFIASDGTTSSGSGDFTSVRNSTGIYTITYTASYVSWATVTANPSGTATLALIVSSGLGSFQVSFVDLADSATDTAFSFITMGA